MQSLTTFTKYSKQTKKPHTSYLSILTITNIQSPITAHWWAGTAARGPLVSWSLGTQSGMGAPAPIHTSHHHRCAKELREPWTQQGRLQQRGRGQKRLSAPLGRDHGAENQTPSPSSNSTPLFCQARGIKHARPEDTLYTTHLSFVPKEWIQFKFQSTKCHSKHQYTKICYIIT